MSENLSIFENEVASDPDEKLFRIQGILKILTRSFLPEKQRIIAAIENR
jgi:hypothetical protein